MTSTPETETDVVERLEWGSPVEDMHKHTMREAAAEIRRLRSETAALTDHIADANKKIAALTTRAENAERALAEAVDLLRHADDFIVWEHTRARSGFQEEVEIATGIRARSSLTTREET